MGIPILIRRHLFILRRPPGSPLRHDLHPSDMNYIHSFLWNEVTHSRPNFKGRLVARLAKSILWALMPSYQLILLAKGAPCQWFQNPERPVIWDELSRIRFLWYRLLSKAFPSYTMLMNLRMNGMYPVVVLQIMWDLPLTVFVDIF